MKDSQLNKEPLTGETINLHSGIESNKTEINNLNNQLVAKEEEIKKVAPENSSLLEKLKIEKENLEVQLREKEQELAELQKKNKELEKQISLRHFQLQDRIEEKTKELKEKKRGWLLGKKVIGEKELDEICDIQAEITETEVELNSVKQIRQIFDIKVVTNLPHGIAIESKLEESSHG